MNVSCDGLRAATGIQGVDHLGVAQGAPGGHPIPQPAAQQRGHLPHQTGVEHGVGALLQAIIENRRVPV